MKTRDGVNKTHGHTVNGPTKTYSAWQNMKARCYNPSSKDYLNYSGRNITVCNRWQSFKPFLQDMGIAPEGLTLERKDNNLGYCKENCIWATRLAQAQNRQNSVSINKAPEMFKLKAGGLTQKQIGLIVGCSQQSVGRCLNNYLRNIGNR